MSGAKIVRSIGINQLPQYARRVGGEFIWVALGQAASALGAIFGVRLMTQMLAPDQYGSLSLALTLSTLTLQIILSPLGGAVLRFFAPANESQQLGAYWRSVQRLLAQSTFLVAAVALAALLLAVALGQSAWISVLLITFLYSLVSGYIGVLNGIQNAARQRVIVAWHDGLGTWLRYLFAVLLIWAFAPTSQIALVGFTLASCAVLASQWHFFRSRILRTVASQAGSDVATEQRWRSAMLTYAWPFATWGIFTWLQASSDRWVLEFFGTTELVGLYAALYQLSVFPIVLLTALFSQLITPILFNLAGDGGDPARKNQARWFVLRCTLLVLAATGLGVLASWVLHSWLFSLLVAPEYRSVSPYMPWMILGAGAFAAGQIAALNLLIGNRSDRLIAPKVTTAIAGVLLNIAGGYYWGVEGVIAGGIIFSLLWLLWMLVELFKSNHTDPQRAEGKA
jgi:O-antigen/teichoic acid export membrane protein